MTHIESVQTRERFWRREAFRGILLLALIAALWCIIWGRTSLEAWKVPVSHECDSLLVMSWVKSAADGNYLPLLSKTIPGLGAPFPANWNDYPVTEDALICCIGMAAKIIGVFAACNLAVLIGHLLAGVSFYAVCRWLRYGWEWAFMGAVLFAFSATSLRSLPHIVLLYYWHIPLCLLVCWWFASRRGLGFNNRRYWFALAVGFLTGLQNPYYTNLVLQFLGFAVLAQFLRRNAWQTVAAPASVGAVTLLAFVLMNADSMSYSCMHGRNPGAVARNYATMEVYSMKPMELIIPPPTHRAGLFREIGSKYESEASVKGEMFYSYLGLVGIGALLWLAIATAIRVLQWPVRPVPGHAIQVAWVAVYSVIGGMNCLLGIAGFVLFRCGSRYSIFILTLVLLFLVRELTKLGRRLNSYYRIALAVAICALGLWDQLPKRLQRKDVAADAKVINADRAFTKTLESALPRGTMLFQLPVIDFPESPPVNQMHDYDHLRLYLFSHYLRYSNGNDKGRSADAWQKQVERMPPAEMIATLESYGFGALYINRKGYADNARALLENLKNSGRQQVLQNAPGDLACVLLHPSQSPVFPKPGPVFVKGFYAEERDAQQSLWRWSYGNAEIELLNDSDLPCPVYLNFGIWSPSSRAVDVILESERVVHIALKTFQPNRESMKITLNPGVNKLHFVTDRPASRVKNSPDPRRLAFVLQDFSVEYGASDHPQ